MMVNFIETTANHVKIDQIKNRLLREGMWRVLLDEDITESEKNRAQEIFFEHCTDTILTSNIKKLIRASKFPEKGSQLPGIDLIGIEGNKLNIRELTKDQNTVIYFWPKQLRQIENLAKRVNYLEKQNPTIQFIGINSNNIDYNWKSYIKSNKFNASKQFQLDKQTAQNDWLFIDYSRTILVDKNGNIINGFTHLTNNNFLQNFKKD